MPVSNRNGRRATSASGKGERVRAAPPPETKQPGALWPWTFGGVVAATIAAPTVMSPLLPWTLGAAFLLALLERGYLGSTR
jgi:hypothetical protein